MKSEKRKVKSEKLKVKSVKRKITVQNSKPELKNRAYLYALEVIKFIDSLEKNDFSVQVLSKQLLRSATSVGANIIEAKPPVQKRILPSFSIIP